ncbi:hypothetical protein SLA2020_516760 [Shorea laevis]
MDIPQKLNQYRHQISLAIIASVTIALIAFAAPRFLNILAYFWPLFASTTVLLVIMVAIGGLSQLATETHGERAGEGLLDYVAAARSEHITEPQRLE